MRVCMHTNTDAYIDTGVCMDGYKHTKLLRKKEGSSVSEVLTMEIGGSESHTPLRHTHT